MRLEKNLEDIDVDCQVKIIIMRTCNGNFQNK